jgi:hypothetical protein
MNMTFPRTHAIDQPCSSSQAQWMRRPLLLGCAALFFLLGFQSRAEAQAPVGTPSAYASVFFNHGESPGQEHYDPGTGYSAYVSFTDPDTADLYFGNGSASVTAPEQSPVAQTSYQGIPALHAFANASTPGNSEGVASTASFSDQLNFTPHFSDDVLADLSYSFNFAVSGSLTGDATAALSLSYGSATANINLASGTTNILFIVEANQLSSYTDPVFPGSSIRDVGGLFSAQLIASVINPNGAGGTNTANFSDTVALQSVDVTDANGDPVQGTFSDGDQLLFAANTPLLNTTPEPGTTALLISGLVLVMTVGRSRFWRTTLGA